ncbi:MAG: hypothetical protein ACHQ3P_00445 [Candidatus Limnocylindrales bacterium]
MRLFSSRPGSPGARLRRRRAIARLLLGLVVAASAATCAGSQDGCGGDPNGCIRVLFIGNSYTYVNDLPGTFSHLAASGGRRVATDSVAVGGATLADALDSADRRQRMASARWGFVVLQEQSQIPASPQLRQQDMFPAARTLAGLVEAAGAEPVLFETWAHRDGWPEAGISSYGLMQAQVDDAYDTLSRELGVPEAPVGSAWSIVRGQDPGLALWVDDGVHPTPAGTYLAACVFYATIFHADPRGLSFTDGLAAEDAHLLQETAARAAGFP